MRNALCLFSTAFEALLVFAFISPLAVWAQPANDNFADAIAISGSSGQTTGTNVNATLEAGEPFHFGTTGGKSVWWKWTAAAGGEMRFKTSGSNFDTILAVYTGNAVNALTRFASNNDVGGPQSQLSIAAIPGMTYYVAVDGNGGASGNIVLAWTTLSYEFERRWPVQVDPLSLLYPTGVAVAPDGSTYIADERGFCIVKTDAQGNFVARLGIGPGIADGLFNGPRSISVGPDGSIFVADTLNSRIQKFDANGSYLAQWGSEGTGNGQFDDPYGVSVGPDGSVYVADTLNSRIQKFDANGSYLAQWGSPGTGNGQFNSPYGVSVAPDGSVYVADTNNNRIQKFDEIGSYVTQWGGYGNGNGQLYSPYGVTVGPDGSVYVVDTYNHRIQRFDANGVYLSQWGTPGIGIGQFSYPMGISAGANSSVCVADTLNRRIQKFDSNGVYQAQWGDNKDQLASPAGVAVNSSGTVYVADTGNNRIQRFDSNGVLEIQWGSLGSGNGQFNDPYDVSIGPDGSVYVADRGNYRVQKFDANGGYTAQWGSPGSGDGQFGSPYGVSVGADGSVYVADMSNHRIQKFDENGVYLRQWGSFGTSNGQFDILSDVSVGADGSVYAADMNNHRIQKFDENGVYLSRWGGDDESQYGDKHSLAIDSEGFVYVVDGGYRIQKFDGNGVYLNEWYTLGYHPFVNDRSGIAIAPNGSVYISDSFNSRIEKYVPLEPVISEAESKAIILLGGGAYPDNRLWPATVSSASLAYWALTLQGYAESNIYVLGASPANLDLDIYSDVTFGATNNELSLLHIWIFAGEPVDDLVVYLVDHGGDGNFRLDRNGEILEEADLAALLNGWQTDIQGNLVVVYDACESGTFLDQISAPGRIVITSTSVGQEAHFVLSGQLSFSSFFWPEILNGKSVGDAFAVAENGLGFTSQTSLIEADGNGMPNEVSDRTTAQGLLIGHGNSQYIQKPQSDPPGNANSGVNGATIWAENVVSDPAHVGIERVWGIVTPPTYVPAASTMAVINRATVEMLPVGGERYEGTYDEFVQPGIYTVDVFVEDGNGSIAGPRRTTVTVGSPPSRKAIIVTGGDPASPQWAAYDWAAAWVESALLIQSYTPADIRMLSHSNPGFEPTLASIENVITDWGVTNTRDLTVVFIGPGGLGTFQPNASEVLPWPDVDGWLDTAQANIPGLVSLIVDSTASGSMIPSLVPTSGEPRILVASTGAGQEAGFVNGGVISFSRFFWVETALGASVGEAYSSARESMRFATGQKAEIDDNGDGFFNPSQDGNFALQYSIGTGIGLAGDEPLIGTIVGEQTLGENDTSATIWIENVSTLLTLLPDGVVGLITPPAGGDPVEILLQDMGNGRYEATYNGFEAFGNYPISISAIDLRGVSSAPAQTLVRKPSPTGIQPDIFEEDNMRDSAKRIHINEVPVSFHNFHVLSDVDWAFFDAAAGDILTIETIELGLTCDTLIEIFEENNQTPLDSNDNRKLGDKSSRLAMIILHDGRYFIKVSHATSGHGEGSEYKLFVWGETGVTIDTKILLRFVYGGTPVPNVTLSLDPLGGETAKRVLGKQLGPDGILNLDWYSGQYTLTASAPGYSLAPSDASLGAIANIPFDKVITLQRTTGDIQVFLAPPAAVTAGAQWKLSTDASWRNSGDIAANLAPGQHDVSFKTISGWVEPPLESVTVIANQTSPITRTYQPGPGSIQCTLEPAEARNAGAQWCIDGGAWNNSGATVSAPPGSRIVTFKPINGWITPGAANVTVSTGVNSPTGGTYQRAQLDTPQNVQASDGTFNDRVQITWSGVPGATMYRVFYSTTGQQTGATELGVTADLVANHMGAAAPAVTNQSSGGCPPQTTQIITPVVYTYWIQALAPGNLQSSWGGGDTGYRGPVAKSEDAGLTPFETALPSIPAGANRRMARPQDALSVRVRSEWIIDVAGIAANVAGVKDSEYTTEFVPVPGGDGKDGWYVVKPSSRWPDGATIEVTLMVPHRDGPDTTLPTMYFDIDPQAAASVPALDGMQDITLVDVPVPATSPTIYPIPVGDPDTVLVYFVAGGDRPGWYPAQSVAGLLAGDPERIYDESGDYWAMTLYHGGYFSVVPQVKLAGDGSEIAPSGLPLPQTLGALGVFVLMAALLIAKSRTHGAR